MDRRLAAILSADIAGYSRLLGEDEEATVRALQDHLSAILPLISEHGGHVIDTAGDGLLAEFPSVVGAVRAALAIQSTMAARNEGVAEGRRLEFRVGINQGEIVIDREKVYGDGLNVAARLQAVAEPGGIAASARVHEDVTGKLDVTWEDLGEQSFRNIARPVRVFRWVSGVRASAAAVAKLPPAILDRPSVAVLPFDNLGDQTGETYFSDGITEDIITGLARFRSLTVIARNSSFAFRGKAVDLTEIGRRLGASYILEGSVRRAANRVRVTAQLIEAATGAHVWAERYDRDLDEVFAVQDELARSIVSTLVGRIQDARLQQSLRKPTSSLAAYDCVLRGVASFRGFGESANQRAYEMFERAVALDPQYAQAHAYLAMAYLALHGHAAAPSEVLDTAFAIASRAIELDPQDSNGHRVVGLVWMYRRDFDSAEHHYRRALELSPDDPDRRMGLGYFLVLRGRAEEGLATMQDAMRLNPFPPTWYSARVAVALFTLKRYADAVQAFKRIPEAGYWMRARLAACYAHLGNHAEARAQVEAIRRLRPTFSIDEFMRADVLLERPEDRDHLREGLTKAGLPVVQETETL